MPRKLRKAKPLVYIFCEGESVQAYAEFLKTRFQDVAVLKIASKPGLFEEVSRLYTKDSRFISSVLKSQTKSVFSSMWRSKTPANGKIGSGLLSS